jgi:lysozyme
MANTILRLGDTSTDVLTLKQLLQDKGFIARPEYFDLFTAQAVEGFQKTFGLASDGIVGNITWDILNKINSWTSGIDVSQYQGNIDWGKVAQTDVKFAITRLNYGSSYLDPTFQTNWQGIKQGGLVRGVYQFLLGNQSIEAQLDLLFKYVPQLEEGDLPPILDVESDASQGINAGISLKMAVDTWIEAVRRHYNCYPIIYTGKYTWDLQVGTDTSYGQYPLWVATYFVSQPILPTSWTSWRFWQYNTRTVQGIWGAVDANYFQGSEKDLHALASRRNA